MIENRTSKAVHFGVAALTGPATKEKLAQISRHTELWLPRIATRTVHSVQINRNRGFRTVSHTQ